MSSIPLPSISKVSTRANHLPVHYGQAAASNELAVKRERGPSAAEM